MVFESNVLTLRGVVPILYVFGLSALAGRHKAFGRTLTLDDITGVKVMPQLESLYLVTQ